MATPSIIAANNATTVLASGISATATTLTVASGTGDNFPTPVSGTSIFKLTITDAASESISEIVHVTAVSGDIFTIVRGQEGTAARTWSVNDIAANMLTAGTIAAMAQYDTTTFIAATTGRLINVQVFQTNGSFNYIPTAGTKRAKAYVTGAGGGGTGCNGTTVASVISGGGGGGGGTAIGLVNITLASYPIVVGKGGTGGIGITTAATNGSASTFAGLTGNGGFRGSVATTSSAGGDGGTSTGGLASIQGGMGCDGQFNSYLFPGYGGSSMWGGGGRPGNPNGNDGRAPGSGGSGAYNNGGVARTGGAGQDGIIIIEEYA